jgi:RNA polymerase sigma-70 factor (ECF subfamily)
MRRIQVRDESALNELIRRHRGSLRGIVAQILHHDPDVDDAIQDVFLYIWNHADLFDTRRGKALGWMITIARRRAIDRLRSRQSFDRAHERMRLTRERDPLAAGIASTIQDDASKSDCATMLARVLEKLPPSQRQAVKLAFYHGLSQREIAARTSTPLGTIKTRLEYGLRKMRAAVIAAGGQREWSLTAA